MSGTIRTGVIGFGLSGRVFHAPFIAASPEFSLELIATSNPERRAQAESRYPGVTVVDTPDQLLERAAQLDLVVLASPAHAHLAQGLAAFAAGAAVVVDKPFVPSVAAGQQLIAAAEAAARPLIVFQNRRWDGDFLTVKRLIAKGKLGRIHRFESTFERFSPPRPGRWQEAITPEQGGGIAFDLGSHLVDQALQLFGPGTVASAEFSRVRDGAVNEDDAFISLHHGNGVHSHLTMSRVAALSGPRFRVLGTEGAYAVHGLDGQESALGSGILPTDPGYGITPPESWGTLQLSGQATATVATERGGYPSFYEGVASAVRGVGPAPVDARDALDVVRIIEEAHRLQ